MSGVISSTQNEFYSISNLTLWWNNELFQKLAIEAPPKRIDKRVLSSKFGNFQAQILTLKM